MISEYPNLRGWLFFREKSVYKSDVLIFIHASMHHFHTFIDCVFFLDAPEKARQAEGLRGEEKKKRHFLPETWALNCDREMKGEGTRKRCKDRDKHWRAEPRCWSCCIWDQRSGFSSLFFCSPTHRQSQDRDSPRQLRTDTFLYCSNGS